MAANQNVTQLTQQTISAAASSLFYAVTGGSNDTGLPLSVLVNNLGLTGVPTAPTAAFGTATTQIASTAFVHQNQSTFSITNYGGDPTGNSDCTAAFAAAISASLASNGSAAVYFPAGKYKFSSQVVYTFPNVKAGITVWGAGSNVTELTWPNAGGGFQFNYIGMQNAVHFNGLTLTTGIAGGGTGIVMENATQTIAYDFAQNTLEDISFRGTDGPYGNFYWTSATQALTVSGINYISTTIYGGGSIAGNGHVVSGYNVTGTTSAATSSSSNVLHFTSVPAGIQVGMWAYDSTTPSGLAQANATQVVSFTSTTVTLSINATGGGVQIGDSIVFQNAGIAYNFFGCTFFSMVNPIIYATGAQGVAVSACNFTTNTYGIVAYANQFGLTELAVCGSNQFNTNQEQIYALSPIADVIISGNLLYVLDNTATYPGIHLAQAERFNISGNDFVDLHSGGTPPIAISIGNTNGLGGSITGNNFNGFSTGVVLGASSAQVFCAPQAFIGTTTPVTDSGTNNTTPNNYLRVAPQIGSTTPNTGAFTTLTASTSATVTGPVVLNASNANITINDTSGTNQASILFQKAGTTNWYLSSASTNAFQLNRQVSGTFVDTPFTVANATGIVTMVDGISNTPIGATSPSTGNFTTLNTTNGANFTGLTSVTGSNLTYDFIVTDTGSNGAGIALTGNGSTTPTKFIRVNNGNMQVVNSAYTGVIFTLTDAGVLSTLGGISGTPISGSTGSFTTITASSTITPSQTSGIVGTTTSNNANAGSIGEYVSATASGVSLTSSTAANITSMSLTAGDWDVSGIAEFAAAATTTNTFNKVSISTTSATQGALGTATGQPWVFTGANTVDLTTPIVRLSLASTTTVYLVGTGIFGVSTESVSGVLRARRVR